MVKWLMVEWFCQNYALDKSAFAYNRRMKIDLIRFQLYMHVYIYSLVGKRTTAEWMRLHNRA